MEKASKIFMRVIFPLTAAAMLVSLYFRPQQIIKVLPLFFSLAILILNVKVSRFGPLAGSLNSLLYGLSYVLLGLYGNAAFAVLVSFPLQLITFINWSKHLSKGKATFKKLGVRRSLILTAAAAAVWVCLYLILRALGSASAILDNTTTILAVISTVLMVVPYVEYIYINVLTSVMSLIMYIKMIPTSPEALTFLIFTVYSFTSIVLTMLNTIKLYNEQQRNAAK